MTFLFIGTTGNQAGQSLVAWAVARRLKERGLTTGFFKPCPTPPLYRHDISGDSDALLFKDALDIQDPLEKICPDLDAWATSDDKDAANLMGEVSSLAAENAVGKDVLLIVGSEHIFFDEVTQLLPDVSLISELGADLILVHRYKKFSTTVYSLLSVISLLRERVKGIIINRVPLDCVAGLKAQIVPVLIQKGPFVIVLPEDPVLTYKNVGRINQIIGGEIICGEAFLDRLVANITVGAGTLTGDLQVFRRVYNKIVLLGPEDAGDNPAGIILTGNRKPADPVLRAAEKSNIPLLLAKEDSFAVKERLENDAPVLTTADENKVIHFTAMMDEDNALNRLVDVLGLQKGY